MPRLTRTNHEIGQRFSFFGPPTPTHLSGSTGYSLNRINPAGNGNQIIPQVIACPWSVDDNGETIPAGTMAVRTISPGRAAEEALSGTDADNWILVPGTLPGGYTSRPQRDHNKSGINPYRFFPTSEYRGNPYIYSAHVDAGDGPITSAPAVSGRYYTVNGLGGNGAWPASWQTMDYRPSGGGGIANVSYYPVNDSNRAISCYMTIGANNFSAGFWIPPGGGVFGVAPASVWLQPHPGWRACKLRLLIVTTTATMVGNVQNPVEVAVRHNANESMTGYGDTADFYTTIPIASFTNVAFLGGLYYWNYELNIGSLLPATKVFRPYIVGWNWYSLAPGVGPGINGTGYENRLFASPRVDIPLWFSAYGAGTYAPGGV